MFESEKIDLGKFFYEIKMFVYVRFTQFCYKASADFYLIRCPHP